MYIIERLAVAEDEIDRAFNITFSEEMAACIVAESVLSANECTTKEVSFVS